MCENPDQADIRALLEESDAYYAELYPAESNHLLDVAKLQLPNVAFYAIRQDGALLGFGSLVQYLDYAELKRMYIAPQARGKNCGRRLLQALEDHAARAGLQVVRLETGIRQAAAIALYRSSGYRDIDPFGSYVFDELSVFMEKQLA